MADPDAASPIAPGRARAILLGLAAGYVAFGVAFLLAPAKMAAYVDLGVTSHVALIELRAFYGGIELGLGCFLAIAAVRKEWHAPGLLAALLSLLGIAAARVYGISREGSASFLIYVFLAIEVAGVLAAGWGLVDNRRPAGEPKLEDPLGIDEAKFQKLEQKAKVEKTLPIERTKTLVERTVKLDKK